ncbi:RNA polymerase sigma-70 factor [Plesiocystis pacifica SIR-1]|uniref:RNA polymerase sigma-70 factor n=1 Tax=Plesiocystis pacifica SIR-1 TaxID=391625 RepID=A6G924_9BACT|nr:RNA polymerase sigma factor [Plesiocystis pacifica]EDM77572.1 RNA polymerase sigma-70 factor [Plesiocystis pacifica SIR-1]
MATDAELVEAWRAGQKRAGKLLFERHFEAVDRFFQSKVGPDAPDLVQKTFLGCVESIDKYRGEGSFRSWLFAVAYRQLCRHYRSRARDRLHFDAGTSAVRDLEPTPSGVLARRREERLLLEALRGIPLELQVALELHYWEHMSDREVALALGVAHGTMKSRLRRGRKLLAERLETMNVGDVLLESTSTDLEAWARDLREIALAAAQGGPQGDSEDDSSGA